MHAKRSFGKWVQQRRKSLDLTQKALAQHIGCSVSEIQKIEIDVRQPSLQIAELLVEYLELSPDERDAFLHLARHHPRSTETGTLPLLLAQPIENRLPIPLTSLIGREWEVSTLCATLVRPEVRLLTITGPPGIGKTRLALQVASELQGSFADGAVYVPLAPIADGSFVLTSIARALDLKDTSSQGSLVRLKSFLQHKEMLLVLDNFEHVLAAAASVAELLESAAQLKVVTTSRALLQLYGEHEFVVPPLAVPNLKHLVPVDDLTHYAAVELFVKRAQAARLEFELNEQNATAVAELCVHLDGLPLAIELAASRSKQLSPQALLVRLTNPHESSTAHIKLLSSHVRNLPPKQQTLYSAIEWSYRLLTSSERQVFRCMGVFTGGFSLDALNAVVHQTFATNDSPGVSMQQDSLSGIDDWLLHIVGALVDQSMVVQRIEVDTARFTLLETLREFALLQLEQHHEITAAHYAHARYFTLIAESFKNAAAEEKTEPLLHTMELEIDNFRKALLWTDANDLDLVLRLAVALSEYWSQRQHLNEGRQWLERLCLRLKAAYSSWSFAYQRQYAEMLNMLAFFTFLQGDSRLAKLRWEEAIILWHEQQNHAALGRSLYFLACTLHDRGEYHAALEAAYESLAILQPLGDDALLGWTLSLLGRLMTVNEEYAKATEYFEQALAIYRHLGHQWSISKVKLDRCDLLLATGEIECAQATLEEVLPTFQKVDHLWMIARTLHLLGNVFWLQGNTTRAIELWNQVTRVATEIDARLFLAGNHYMLGLATQLCQKQDEAQRHFYDSLVLYQAIENKIGVAYALSGLAGLQDSPINQVQLLAAASNLLDTDRLSADLIERQHHEQLVNAAHDRLEQETFAAAWESGRAMPFEEAIRRVEPAQAT